MPPIDLTERRITFTSHTPNTPKTQLHQEEGWVFTTKDEKKTLLMLVDVSVDIRMVYSFLRTCTLVVYSIYGKSIELNLYINTHAPILSLSLVAESASLKQHWCETCLHVPVIAVKPCIPSRAQSLCMSPAKWDVHWENRKPCWLSFGALFMPIRLCDIVTAADAPWLAGLAASGIHPIWSGPRAQLPNMGSGLDRGDIDLDTWGVVYLYHMCLWTIVERNVFVYDSSESMTY